MEYDAIDGYLNVMQMHADTNEPWKVVVSARAAPAAVVGGILGYFIGRH